MELANLNLLELGLLLPVFLHMHKKREGVVRQKVPFPFNYILSRYEYLFLRLLDGGVRGYGFLGKMPRWVLNILADRVVIPLFSAEVITNEEAVNMVKRLGREGCEMALGQCVCRRATKFEEPWDGKGLDPNRTCIMINKWAKGHDYNTPHLFKITPPEEILEVLKVSKKTGRINTVYGCFQADYSAIAICNCVQEYCVPLRAFLSEGYKAIAPGYNIISYNSETCKGAEKCGACLKRCAFGVFSNGNKELAVNQQKCAGCGACIPSCPTKSLTLKPRPGRILHYAPPDLVAPV